VIEKRLKIHQKISSKIV